MYRALCDQFDDVHILENSWGWAEPLRHLVNAMPEAITLRARWRLHLLFGPIIAKNVADIMVISLKMDLNQLVKDIVIMVFV